MAGITLSGRVASGRGHGTLFTGLPWVRKAFLSLLGIDPFPGTLNLKIEDVDALQQWEPLRAGPGIVVLPPPDSEFCRARCYRVQLAGDVRAAIVYPEVPDYPDDQLELIAPVSLRETLNLADGDRLELEVTEDEV